MRPKKPILFSASKRTSIYLTMPGSKRIVFTINNPQDGNICALNALMEQDSVQWGAYQYEQGANGTVHIQGAIYFYERVPLQRCILLLQGVQSGCGCEEHPLEIEDSDTEIQMTPEPESDEENAQVPMF